MLQQRVWRQFQDQALTGSLILLMSFFFIAVVCLQAYKRRSWQISWQDFWSCWSLGTDVWQIERLLENAGARLVIPQFKRAAQLTKEETKHTQEIACLRIVVERAIQ